MKIYIDDKEVLSLSPIQEQVIKSQIDAGMYQADLERRIKWLILDEHYGSRLKDLKAEWEPKLAQRMASIPTDPDALAQLIFSQPDYKDGATKQAEARAARARAMGIQ